MSQITTRLRELYDGDTNRAHRFRYGLLAFDLATILFVVVSSFWPLTTHRHGHRRRDRRCWCCCDFSARLSISEQRAREFLRPSTWADIAAHRRVPGAGPRRTGRGSCASSARCGCCAPTDSSSGFARDSAFFRRNEEVIVAVTNLSVFVFVMTGIVYATQHQSNPAIRHYVDALYFTVTSLTTTGYGDITLPGTTGRVISVVVMICGVTLFLRLAQVLFRPNKVRFAVSRLRAPEARTGCRSLQGVRDTAEHSRRRLLASRTVMCPAGYLTREADQAPEQPRRGTFHEPLPERARSLPAARRVASARDALIEIAPLSLTRPRPEDPDPPLSRMRPCFTRSLYAEPLRPQTLLAPRRSTLQEPSKRDTSACATPIQAKLATVTRNAPPRGCCSRDRQALFIAHLPAALRHMLSDEFSRQARLATHRTRP